MNKYFTRYDNNLTKEYLTNGYVICKIENTESLNWIKEFYFKKITSILDLKITNIDIFNNFHRYVKPKKLNEFRMKIIIEINKSSLFRKHYYNLASRYLEALVGNELVMQKNINLSIQMPKDNSSLLEVHADTWSGDSPYESVVWLPLVNCFGTKSMYILPSFKYGSFLKKFKSSSAKKNFNLYQSIKYNLRWLDIKFGEVLLFNQCLPHGNVVNQVNETRWSMNCRFKSVFTPYGDKKIGEFFQPITLRAASVIGMEYELPIEKK